MGGMGAEVDFLTACRAQYHKVGPPNPNTNPNPKP